MESRQAKYKKKEILGILTTKHDLNRRTLHGHLHLRLTN